MTTEEGTRKDLAEDVHSLFCMLYQGIDCV